MTSALARAAEEQRVLDHDPRRCVRGVRELEPRADVAGGEDPAVRRPQAIVDRINKSANTALAEPDVIKALTANGFEIVGGKPDVFAKAMSKYISDTREIGRKNNLEIE